METLFSSDKRTLKIIYELPRSTHCNELFWSHFTQTHTEVPEVSSICVFNPKPLMWPLLCNYSLNFSNENRDQSVSF